MKKKFGGYCHPFCRPRAALRGGLEKLFSLPPQAWNPKLGVARTFQMWLELASLRRWLAQAWLGRALLLKLVKRLTKLGYVVSDFHYTSSEPPRTWKRLTVSTLGINRLNKYWEQIYSRTSLFYSCTPLFTSYSFPYIWYSR